MASLDELAGSGMEIVHSKRGYGKDREFPFLHDISSLGCLPSAYQASARQTMSLRDGPKLGLSKAVPSLRHNLGDAEARSQPQPTIMQS